ncbi:MAG: hypothetical protein HYZ87_04340, partial [Candidatus Omnitrophica bacterium]|nr:hypothetical protein [Candidatus Omnitrophota bacterium]
LHPHAYALEGLAYAGFHLRRPDYVASAVKGFEWMMKAVSSDGSVSSLYENGAFAHHERSDIVGQALRLGALLYALEPRKIKPYLGTLEAVKKHLMQFQFHEEGEQDGGFLYGSSTDGLMRNHLNAWSTMFALQALWMHRQFITQKKDLILESFV